MANSLKHELADHIYQYLCHEAQYSDLPEAAKESLTAASECIEQAYKLNVATNSHHQSNATSTPTSSAKQANSDGANQQHHMRSADILPDELLRIFTRHKEFLSQQKDTLIYPLRNTTDDSQTASTSIDKPDVRINSNSLQQQSSNNSNDHQNNNTNNPNMSPTFNHNNNNNANNNNSNSNNNHTTSASTTTQQPSSSTNPNQQIPAITATNPAAKSHNQHPISQLPMTTRKKLSHLRAQIKRQASKAARSRLEKRSSVSGVANSSGDKPGHHFGMSFDASSSKLSGDPTHQHHKELHNQPNSSSSTESPHAYLSNQSTSSPVTGGSNNNNQDTNASMNLSPTQLQSEGGPSASGASGGNKLIGQHSLSVAGHHGNHHSIHQKNFKQKIIALLKKFRTDGSDFDSEEQYREALERELMKAAAGRGSRAIEELLEEDIDVEEESGSEAEDWDNISESSTPKPSLRPFFSSTTLDKI